MFRGSEKGTGYPLHSPVPLHFPSRASPCAITFQLESTSQHLPPVELASFGVDWNAVLFCAEIKTFSWEKCGLSQSKWVNFWRLVVATGGPTLGPDNRLAWVSIFVESHTVAGEPRLIFQWLLNSLSRWMNVVISHWQWAGCVYFAAAKALTTVYIIEHNLRHNSYDLSRNRMQFWRYIAAEHGHLACI
jgi:hypothetical protein